jgi:hypothetical protein
MTLFLIPIYFSSRVAKIDTKPQQEQFLCLALGCKQVRKQASKYASNKQVRKQASTQASTQASKQI